MAWFSKDTDEQVIQKQRDLVQKRIALSRYNNILTIKLIKELQSLYKELSKDASDDYLKKNDLIHYARTKLFYLTRIKQELDNSKLFSRDKDIDPKFVPIKEAYVHLYKMIFDKKRDKYSYYELLLRFSDGKSEGDMPSAEEEIIKELTLYRDKLAADFQRIGRVDKSEIDAINSQFDVSSQFSKIAGRIARDNLVKTLLGVLIIGAMCLSVAEPKVEDNNVAGQTEHISDSTKMVHNFHK